MKCNICNDSESISLPVIIYDPEGRVINIESNRESYPCPKCMGTFVEGYYEGYKASAINVKYDLSGFIEESREIFDDFIESINEFSNKKLNIDPTPPYWDMDKNRFLAGINKKKLNAIKK